METTIERLKNQVLAGQPLADVTVLDLLGKLDLLQQEAREAQEDAIHQTARAEQAEATVSQLNSTIFKARYALEPKNTQEIMTGLADKTKQATGYEINAVPSLSAYTEGVEHATTILTSRITRILNGEAND